MPELIFELVTPEGVKFTAEAYEILLPTPTGQIGILPHHMPLVALASAGVVSIRAQAADSDSQHFAVSGGLLEIDGNRVRLLADTADHSSDIDTLKAQEALDQARKLAKSAQDQVALADATALIERYSAQLKVAGLRRRHTKAKLGE